MSWAPFACWSTPARWARRISSLPHPPASAATIRPACGGDEHPRSVQPLRPHQAPWRAMWPPLCQAARPALSRPAVLLRLGTWATSRSGTRGIPPTHDRRQACHHQWGWEPTPRPHPRRGCGQSGRIGASLEGSGSRSPERGDGPKSLRHGHGGSRSK